MSRYADIADVRAQLPQRRYDTQTTPTIDDVLRFCTNRSAELDGILLDRGLSAPVNATTSPVSFGWLRSACAYGAAMDAEAAAVTGMGGQGDAGEPPRLAFLRKQWERMLTLLQEGKIGLGDATPLPSDGEAGRGPRGADRFGCGSSFFRRDQTWTGPGSRGSMLP